MPPPPLQGALHHHGRQGEVSPVHPASGGGRNSALLPPGHLTLAAMVAWLAQGFQLQRCGVSPPPPRAAKWAGGASLWWPSQHSAPSCSGSRPLGQRRLLPVVCLVPIQADYSPMPHCGCRNLEWGGEGGGRGTCHHIPC